LATEYEAPLDEFLDFRRSWDQYGDEGLDYYLQPGSDDDSDHGFYVM
jgi:hypothetical protein